MKGPIILKKGVQLKFGRYNNEDVMYVALTNASYINWMLTNITDISILIHPNFLRDAKMINPFFEVTEINMEAVKYGVRLYKQYNLTEFEFENEDDFLDDLSYLKLAEFNENQVAEHHKTRKKLLLDILKNMIENEIDKSKPTR